MRTIALLQGSLRSTPMNLIRHSAQVARVCSTSTFTVANRSLATRWARPTPLDAIRVGEIIWGSILNFSFGRFVLHHRFFFCCCAPRVLAHTGQASTFGGCEQVSAEGPSEIERELPELPEFTGTSSLTSCRQVQATKALRALSASCPEFFSQSPVGRGSGAAFV